MRRIYKEIFQEMGQKTVVSLFTFLLLLYGLSITFIYCFSSSEQRSLDQYKENIEQQKPERPKTQIFYPNPYREEISHPIHLYTRRKVAENHRYLIHVGKLPFETNLTEE